ncbi:hypothetical protein ACFYSF_22905 [Streptomyces canus]|uniref:hypothetical protein n=1 Tax=Streptomyces canus TaxID=58343 RepID=UPI0036B749B3
MKDVASLVIQLLGIACFLLLPVSVVARQRIEQHMRRTPNVPQQRDRWTGDAS